VTSVGRASDFKGQEAVVTAVNCGLGRAIAERLRAGSVRGSVRARMFEASEDAAAALGGPPTVMAVPGESDQLADGGEVFDRAREAVGRLDTVVLNACMNLACRNFFDLGVVYGR
jgi:NAD(P)-dependent dehydrogenase (short-subunit alcohol dehydrogenase family)